MGKKEIKASRNLYTPVVFKTYSIGAATGRDRIVYNFSRSELEKTVKTFIENYNSEIYHWVSAGKPKNVDDFVNYDKVKWSRNLKRDLQHEIYAKFDEIHLRKSLYRPFTVSWLYFADIVVDEQGTTGSYFPTGEAEAENCVIVVSDHGYRSPFSVLATNMLPDQHVLASTDAFQCFPFYVYSMDGSNRRENITDWSLKQFQAKYGEDVTKWDIFYYVYGLLHHPQYRALYKENLKRDLPYIPLLLNQEGFEACVSVGKQLMDLHMNYEKAEEYPLRLVSDKHVPYVQRLRVEKMKLSADKASLVYSKGLTLEDIPQECSEYRLGNRSALEWVIDQYQVSTDKRSGIESDPNRLDDPQYIIRLIKQVVTVSVKTVELVKELAEAVTAEDWLGESVDVIKGVDVSIQD